MSSAEFVPHPLLPLINRVKGCARATRRELSQGYPEAVYQQALIRELSAAGLSYQVEVPLEVHYKGEPIGHYRADIIVAGELILELKAVAAITIAHQAQLVNYLKATGKQVGMIINFGQHPIEFKIKFQDERITKS